MSAPKSASSSPRSKNKGTTATGEAPSHSVFPIPEGILQHHRSQLIPLLKQWRIQDRVPPVLLLTGPQGIGKREIAYWLSQVLLCERSGFGAKTASSSEEEESSFGFGFLSEPQAAQETESTLGISELPCSNCPACQKALSGNWIDFTEISPEGDADHAGTLKIEQFRKLKASQGFSAFDGSYRITLIRDADRLTPQAGNSLLKLLEEPPPGWIFLLSASDPSLLLPTLVSRCQKLRLAPLSQPLLIELLHGAKIPTDRISVCVQLSQGSYRKALQLAEDETWEKRAVLFRFLDDPAAELSSLTDWAASEDRNFKILLDQFEQILLDLVSLDEDPIHYAWKNTDGKRTLTRHAQLMLKELKNGDRARAFWLERSARLFKMRMEVNIPLNRKTLAQDFLAGWIAPPKT